MVFSHVSWPSPRSFGGASTVWHFEGGSTTSRKKYSAYSNGNLACSVAALSLYHSYTCDANIPRDICRSIKYSPCIGIKTGISGFQTTSSVHQKMETRNSDVEVLESSFSVRWRFFPLSSNSWNHSSIAALEVDTTV